MNQHALNEQQQRASALRAQIATLCEELRVLDGETTWREEATRALAESSSEQRFRHLADTMPVIVWTAEAEGLLDYVNIAFIRLTGIANDLELGQAWFTVVHPDDLARCDAAWQLAVTQQQTYALEFRLRRASDGAYLWHMVRAEPMRDAQGGIVKWYGTAVDIDRMRSAEEESTRLAAELRATLESITDVFFALDEEQRFAYANAQAQRLIGNTGPALKRTALREALPSALGEAIAEAVARCARERSAVELALPHDGGEAWLAGRVYPSLSGFAVYLRDETQTRSAQEAQRTSEERFRLLSRATNDAIWDWNIQTNALWWNEGFESLFGYPLEAVVADLSSWSQHIHPDDHGRIVGTIKAAIAQGQAQWTDEYRFARSDGSYAYVLDRGYIMRDERGQPVRMIGGMTDLSERKAAEEQLTEQAALIEKAQDAILVRDLEGHIRYVNARAELLYGWSRDEAIGQDVRQLQFASHVEMFERANAATLRDGAWAGELEQVRRDGKVVLVEGRWTLLRRADQTPYGILEINTDISERKRLEQHILRAQRLESIGTLAGGIAHDLNNVLTPIVFCLELLREGEQDTQRLDDLDTIERCAKRASAMIAQLLLFARGDEGSRAQVKLTSLVREIEHLVRDTFPKNITLCTRWEDTLWPLLGDSTQLNQVLMNLCVNARDAMPHGGTLTLTLENLVIDEIYAGMNPGVSPGKYVVLRVEDTGEGMSREVLERMFEPFYTTKAHGKGTGLGLSTTHAIVKRHGGFIHVYSEQGRGSQLHVYLPAEPCDDEEGALASQPFQLPRGRGECVLVVDDEESIRHMVKRTLERFGYAVMLAEHGAEAIALYAQHRAKIDVILTDMAMPVMDGAALIIAVRAIAPRAKIIGSSGLDANGKVAAAIGAGVKHFVAKPYTAELMLHTLRRALDEDAAP